MVYMFTLYSYIIFIYIHIHHIHIYIYIYIYIYIINDEKLLYPTLKLSSTPIDINIEKTK